MKGLKETLHYPHNLQLLVPWSVENGKFPVFADKHALPASLSHIGEADGLIDSLNPTDSKRQRRLKKQTPNEKATS